MNNKKKIILKLSIYFIKIEYQSNFCENVQHFVLDICEIIFLKIFKGKSEASIKLIDKATRFFF